MSRKENNLWMDGSVADKLEIARSRKRGTEVFLASRINSTHVMQDDTLDAVITVSALKRWAISPV